MNEEGRKETKEVLSRYCFSRFFCAVAIFGVDEQATSRLLQEFSVDVAELFKAADV
jgi:hypothetical protein